MSPQTEAACLLESGTRYGTRLLLREKKVSDTVSHDPIFAGFKPGAFSVYFGDAPIAHFDLEGRWQRAFRDGRHYLKGLDTSVQTIDRIREGENLVLRRQTLSGADARAFDALIRADALGLLAAIDAARLEAVAPPSKARPLALDELRGFLERIASWDSDRWESHRARYAETYGPLPFLPPDCPSPVVVQATIGHEGAAFGGAPVGAYVVHSRPEFERHVESVAGLLGRRVEQGKSVFLGGADVLRCPPGDVAGYLEILSRAFPIDDSAGPRRPNTLGGVHAFLDTFDSPPIEPEALRSFRAGGLARVSVGVESGAPEVRALFGKSWADDALRATVSAYKGAGIGVSVIALFGVKDADRHVDATSTLINSLELGPGDLVSLIDASEFGTTAPVEPSAPVRAAQLEALKARLAPIRTERKAKVAPYSLEKQGGV